jgi:hypothetical protein
VTNRHRHRSRHQIEREADRQHARAIAVQVEWATTTARRLQYLSSGRQPISPEAWDRLSAADRHRLTVAVDAMLAVGL